MDFTKIDELKAKLNSLGPLSFEELEQLREEFMIEHIYNSNAIEGNTLTISETALIIQEGIAIAQKPVKDHIEVIGYKDAFEHICTLTNAQTDLSEHTIKDIHSLVMMIDAHNRGVYRYITVRILGAMHVPPQPYLVPVQMEQIIEEYRERHSTKHIIELVSEFHIKFEGIHPFIDGNGRTGRLIMNLELMKAGLLPVNIKFTDRMKYYDCFDDHYLKGNCSMLADLITQYEIEELQRYISIIENR